MTPGQARFALTGFLLVTVGVAFNAIFLQTKPIATARALERPTARPGPEQARLVAAPDEAARQAAEAAHTGAQPLRIARFAPNISAPGDGPPGAPVTGTDRDAGPDTVRAIQRELRLQGYGALPGDGSLGLATRAAIIAFEQDQGLTPTGVASERLLRRILFGVSGGESAAAAKDRSPHVEQLNRAVQQWLASLGYQPGRVDGMLGESTVQAIRDFEVDKGLVPRGRITADLVRRLSEAASPKAQGR
jgi:peptidoglycan hydrolase-like protein with peptidoglycan-binding domain